jgi:hypothetical protein
MARLFTFFFTLFCALLLVSFSNASHAAQVKKQHLIIREHYTPLFNPLYDQDFVPIGTKKSTFTPRISVNRRTPARELPALNRRHGYPSLKLAYSFVF